MVTYEEALKKAKEILPGVNNCVEYEHGYMFAHNTGKVQFGGAGAPVVILKDTGKAVTMAYFNGKYDEDEPLKETKVK